MAAFRVHLVNIQVQVKKRGKSKSKLTLNTTRDSALLLFSSNRAHKEALYNAMHAMWVPWSSRGYGV